MQTMEGELLIIDAEDLNANLTVLADHDVKTTILPWVDPCGTSAVWLEFSVTTDLDEDHFGSWLQDIVEPHNGDVIEWGLARAGGEKANDPRHQ